MAVKIRLARHGAKKRPYYRVVVADGRRSRDGKWIEQVGYYNPCVSPVLVDLDLPKIEEWIKKGAQPSKKVTYLIKQKVENAEKNLPRKDAANEDTVKKLAAKKPHGKAEPKPFSDEEKLAEELKV
ncbi:MAG: 30S ribosomal protein S16 [Eggerthellaceae bacterium]|nr:30S ribosomal protein S16 [Eggerthellaceae bacterium]